MSPEREALVFRDILQMVIWGSSEEDVMHKLEINEITGERAQELYREARKERIRILRSDAMGSVTRGALLLGGAILWLVGEDGTPNRFVFVSCAVSSVLGGWWLIGGVVDFLLAPTKKGSAAEDWSRL